MYFTTLAHWFPDDEPDSELGSAAYNLGASLRMKVLDIGRNKYDPDPHRPSDLVLEDPRGRAIRILGIAKRVRSTICE